MRDRGVGEQSWSAIIALAAVRVCDYAPERTMKMKPVASAVAAMIAAGISSHAFAACGLAAGALPIGSPIRRAEPIVHANVEDVVANRGGNLDKRRSRTRIDVGGCRAGNKVS
jgi:hypothetical protein